MPQPESHRPERAAGPQSAPSDPPAPRPAGRAGRLDDLLDQLDRELGPGLTVARHIGDESFGSLFLAHESALRRDVVIKVLRRDYIGNPEVRKRFEREARAAARISHPNVIPVFRVGTLADGVPFFIEPWVGDCTLKEKLKSVGRFQPSEVREILHQIAAGLDAAHRTGIVHRDVRPETVRCEGESRRLLLTDFGIAGILESGGFEEDTITYPGEILGSPGYMSPEQREGAPATDRSDIYSLGVLAWRLLAGASAPVPEVGEKMDRAAMLGVAPDDPELIDRIARCLREAPEDRPRAEELARAFDPAGGSALRGHGGPKNVFAELIERNVPQTAVIIVVSALAIQRWVFEWPQVSPRLRWWGGSFLGTALLVAIVVSWFHGKKGRQPFTRLEVALLSAIILTFIVAVALVFHFVPA